MPRAQPRSPVGLWVTGRQRGGSRPHDENLGRVLAGSTYLPQTITEMVQVGKSLRCVWRCELKTRLPPILLSGAPGGLLGLTRLYQSLHVGSRDAHEEPRQLQQ